MCRGAVTPVDQTTFGHGTGNCFQACVASVFDLPLEGVPNFCIDFRDAWFDALNTWLRERGMFAVFLKDVDVEFLRRYYGGALMLVGGRNSRGMHEVVYRGGEMVHDPHPSRVGIDTVEDVIIFGVLDPGVAGTRSE